MTALAASLLAPRVCLHAQGAEYTLLARMALSGALCSVTTIMIEWHHRYFYPGETGRVSRGMNLSLGSTGGAAAISWAANTPNGLLKAVAACGASVTNRSQPRTTIMDLDDESYMNDGRPWPDKGIKLCRIAGGKAGSRSRGRAGGNAVAADSAEEERGGGGLLRLIRQYAVSISDEMEEEGLLWLWHGLLGLLALASACCVWECYGLCTDSRD